MKRMFLILVLVLVLISMGIADDFKVKPKFYWSTVTPFVIKPKINQWGLTVVGFDGSLFKCGNFHFPAVGIGLQMYQKKTIGWHTYTNYYGYQQTYYGEGYKFFFEPYLKFVPVKYYWDWMSKALNINSYFEIGITHKGDIVLGLTFSGFIKKKKEKEN